MAEKSKNISVEALLRKIEKDAFCLAARMPMEYTYNFPILQIRKDRLCLLIPYSKYEITGEVDKTYVYPIRYTNTVLIPGGFPIEHRSLEYELEYSKIDFNKPIGLFRHDAIKHLNKKQYKEKRAELFACYDKTVAAILYDEEYSMKDEEKMRELLKLLVEPSQLPIYKALDEDFYNKYLA